MNHHRSWTGTAILLTVIAAQTALTGCTTNCSSFNYSLAADAPGAENAQAAVDSWAQTAEEGESGGAWSEVADEAEPSSRKFANDKWMVTVVELSGGWAVTSGSTC